MNDDDYRHKEWARNIFSSNSEDLLRDRAHKALDGAIAAVRLSESPSLNREQLAASISHMIRDRYRIKFSATRGQLTKRAENVKKFKERISRLTTDLRPGLGELSELLASYGALSTMKGLPRLTALIRGLAQLKREAETLEFLYKHSHSGNSAERIINDQIAPLYISIFKRKPGISRGQDQTPSGPFMRFAQYLERETNPFEAASVAPETIARALTARKNALKHGNIGLNFQKN